MLLGGTIGAGTGALIASNQSGGSGHKTALGLILGAGIGSLLGLGAHKAKEAQEQQKKQDFIFGIVGVGRCSDITVHTADFLPFAFSCTFVDDTCIAESD